MSAQKVAAEERDVELPRYWDKRVSAAYLRIMGMTQEQAANAVGRAERTLRRWESEETWPLARSEARDRWLNDLEDASRRAVLNSVKAGNASLGFEILERLDDNLAPPKQRTELSGAIEVGTLSDAELMERAQQLTNRLTATNAKRNGARG